MAYKCELAQTTSIRAFRKAASVLIVAEGQLPTPGYDAKIEERPERIFPSWYQVLRCGERPGVWPDVVVPFKVSLTVKHPEDADTIRVFHADGDEDVKIESCGEELATFAALVDGTACPDGHESTGFSKNMRFDEAFDDAIVNLADIEPTHPDMLQTVRVVEIGALFGGIAGFNDLYVRVCRTHD